MAGGRRKRDVHALVRIDGLDDDGRGRTRIGERSVPVTGALPGEIARVRYRGGGRVRAALAESIVLPSPMRVEARCPYFGRCGGCGLQHLAAPRQEALKQERLLRLLAAAGVTPARVLEPLVGPPWGYRRRARLGARYVIAKERVLVGFRERAGTYITDMASCQVLVPSLARLVAPLADLLGALSIRSRVPQIEAAAGDGGVQLVMRVLDPPTEADRGLLWAFAEAHGVELCLQPGANDSVVGLDGAPPGELVYRLPEFDLELAFGPHDFIQVNAPLNRQLVARAVQLLDPRPDERVLDLFCGLGNFTLPLARRAGEVIGVELGEAMVVRAWANARLNGIGNVAFHAHDLAMPVAEAPAWLAGGCDKVLVDPPRSGAAAVLAPLAALAPKRIVYVSCNAETLARDSAELQRLGYRLAAAGSVDMFPQTRHGEVLAVFEPG